MITLEEETHTYYDEKGATLPSVTQIIQHFCDYNGIPQEVLDYKSEIGKAVHLATSLFDNDDLDIESIDPVISGYVDGWIKFRADTEIEITANEQIVYHPLYRFAGTLDREGIIGANNVLIDIKCTAMIARHVGVQLAGYDLARMHVRGPIRNRRLAVQLLQDGNYKVQAFEKCDEDERAFLASLELMNWRKKNA